MMLRYLRGLPLKAALEWEGKQFLLCHATPADPLYEYRLKDSTRWLNEEEPVADVLLVGHTHLPFQRYIAGHLVANPGSVGQPKHGQPEACYAIWEDGRLTLASAIYPFEETIRKIRNLPVSVEVREDSAFMLRNGTPP
jgi:predicted phosphodiesterase